MTTITEADYEARAMPELRALLAALDALDVPGMEAELETDILTIEFEDGTRYVINSHRAARQIWMAAERAAWHFDWEPDREAWIATKSGDELWATIVRMVSTKLGRPIALTNPG